MEKSGGDALQDLLNLAYDCQGNDFRVQHLPVPNAVSLWIPFKHFDLSALTSFKIKGLNMSKLLSP